MSDVSITDLTAAARNAAKIADYYQTGEADLFIILADAIEAAERDAQQAEDQANNLAGDVVQLEKQLAAARAGKAYHATQQWIEDDYGDGSPVEWIQGAADEAAVEWQASRKVEAAPSDTEACDWCDNPVRGFAEGQGTGLAHPSCGEGGHGLNFELSRTSQSVRVEVTDEMVDIVQERLYDDMREGDRPIIRAALIAALGGGTQ